MMSELDLEGRSSSSDKERNSQEKRLLEEELANDRSSSTEGPDSPGQSSSSSPIPLIMPVSPYHSARGGHASCSGGGAMSEEDYNPVRLPKYALIFTDEVTKDGDVVKYRIRVKILDIHGGTTGALEIDRQYEDFEYLHHSLTTQCAVDGVIVPPLPPRPTVDPVAAEAKSKRQLGSNNRLMQGDDFRKDCDALAKYMTIVLAHPHFGNSSLVSDFLEHHNPPIRSKIKRGLFDGVRQTLEFRKQSAKDVDEGFQKERDWAGQYGAQIRDVNERFQSVMGAQMRLAKQITHLATALTASVGGNEGANAFYNRLNSRFSTCLEQERRGVEATVANEDRTMGAYLGFWNSYLEAENAMLLRRTCLMVERESAARAFARAKPAKLDQLRLAKEEREDEFERCSKTASSEMRRFHQRRLMEMRDTLVQYTEGQIKCARGAYDELSRCVLKLRDFPLPQVQHEPPAEQTN